MGVSARGWGGGEVGGADRMEVGVQVEDVFVLERSLLQ